MARFVKQGSFGYRDVDLWDCESVILTKQEYISLSRKEEELEKAQKDLTEYKKRCVQLSREYKNLKGRLDQLEGMETLPEGMVAVSEEELNGYKKAVRIVRDRAKQQIDKAKADKNGYTLLRAEKRKYGRDKGSAWLITKSTPYSIKMDFAEASALIAQDLREFYGFIDIPAWDWKGRYEQEELSIKEMLSYNDSYKNGDRSGMQNEKILFYLDWLDRYRWKIIFEVSRFAQNHATGCYEVSYWALSPI